MKKTKQKQRLVIGAGEEVRTLDINLGKVDILKSIIGYFLVFTGFIANALSECNSNLRICNNTKTTTLGFIGLFLLTACAETYPHDTAAKLHSACGKCREGK